MATGQPQQVVVMQQMGQPQTVGTVNGGEAVTGQPQTVVVVQQQPAAVAGTGTVDANRYPRWAYLIFGIGFFAYHFIYFWFWLIVAIISNGIPGYGALFFFCGLVPSTINWVWIINDSTVFCSNPGNGPIQKICCCTCINPWIMTIPMAISAVLRFILWCAFFGIIADFLADVDAGIAIDNFFWFFLTLCAMDCGPCIYLAVDWYYYYGKLDYDAILGTRDYPLRCCVAQQIVIFVISWAFVAIFEEFADDLASAIWPWILHGIIATAILVFGAFLNFSGSLKGNLVSNPIFKFICWGLGIALAILNLIIWGYFLSWAFGWEFANAFVTIILLIYGLYFSALTVPTVWALFSFKVGDTNAV